MSKTEKLRLCWCCGHKEHHGVFVANQRVNDPQKAFFCVRCFSHPDLFFPAKRILPHWIITTKISRKHMKVYRDWQQKNMSQFM